MNEILIYTFLSDQTHEFQFADNKTGDKLFNMQSNWNIWKIFFIAIHYANRCTKKHKYANVMIIIIINTILNAGHSISQWEIFKLYLFVWLFIWSV